MLRIVGSMMFLLLLACPAVAAEFSDVPFNRLQIVGIHNAYHLEPDPAVKTWFQYEAPEKANLDAYTYSHLPISQLLDLGVRQLEIDIHLDPVGGRFSDPVPLREIRKLGSNLELSADPTGDLARPGLKVFHKANVDWRTTCATFRACLREVKEWQQHRKSPTPVIIVLDLKNDDCSIAKCNGKGAVIDFSAQDVLDAEVEAISVLGRAAIFTPDDLSGKYETPRARIEKSGWPTVAEIGNRVLFVLSNAHLVPIYQGENRALRSRLFFVDGEPGNPGAVFVERLSPFDPSIPCLESRGYFVQTFADFGTVAARKNDYSGLDAAIASHASAISTDYAVPDRRFSNYGIGTRRPISPVVQELPSPQNVCPPRQ
jgi:hypothetical protein